MTDSSGSTLIPFIGRPFFECPALIGNLAQEFENWFITCSVFVSCSELHDLDYCPVMGLAQK